MIERTLEQEAEDRTPCMHCGCPFCEHRGGSPGEDVASRRKCPPTVSWGVRCNRGYGTTFEAYWSMPTVFRAQEAARDREMVRQGKSRGWHEWPARELGAIELWTYAMNMASVLEPDWNATIIP